MPRDPGATIQKLLILSISRSVFCLGRVLQMHRPVYMGKQSNSYDDETFVWTYVVVLSMYVMHFVDCFAASVELFRTFLGDQEGQLPLLLAPCSCYIYFRSMCYTPCSIQVEFLHLELHRPLFLLPA